MEKRKLAKIPSEEASDEMVRFSDRATGTHIITTREIEKDLLMLNFYPIKGLKKGKKEAQIRTFFSKNDYITQDLTTEKVKWLTAAFDRMDCISLYKYHWDRETGNRYPARQGKLRHSYPRNKFRSSACSPLHQQQHK